MFSNIQKLISNFFNSLNGLRLSLKEHSFISETIFMVLTNDNSCSWINDLPRRIVIKSINKNENYIL